MPADILIETRHRKDCCGVSAAALSIIGCLERIS